MSKDETIDPSCELTDDELDCVAGGGLLEPIITRREGTLIQTDTFPRDGLAPIPLGKLTGLKF